MTPSTTANPGLRFASFRLRKLERVSGQNAVEKRAITHLQTRGASINLKNSSFQRRLESSPSYFQALGRTGSQPTLGRRGY